MVIVPFVFISAAEAENGKYIAVTLDDSLDWNDHMDMLNFAFENFKSYEIADKESFYVYSGFERYMPNESVYITTTGQSDFRLNYKVTAAEGSVSIDYSTDSTNLGIFYGERLQNAD